MRCAFVPVAIAAGLVVMWSSGFVGAELGTRYAPAETLLAWRFLAIAGPLAVWGLWIHTRARRAPAPESAEAAGGTDTPPGQARHPVPAQAAGSARTRPGDARPEASGVPDTHAGQARSEASGAADAHPGQARSAPAPATADPPRTRLPGGRPQVPRTGGTGPRHTGRRTGRMTGRDAAGHAAVGALAQAGFLYGVYAASAAGAAAGTVALIAALQPLVATALAVPLLGERVRPRQAVGLALGLAGVALVVGADLRAPGAAPWWAYALPVGAMLSLVAATLLERRLRPGGTPVQALAVQCGVSAVLFTALAAGTGTLAPPADPGFWAAVAWVVVLSTLGGYGLYWAALARFGVARVSALLYLTPPTTLLWSLLMFGDPVGAGAVAGMAVCAAAVGLVAGGRGPAGPRPARLRRVPAPAGRRGPRDQVQR